MTRRQARIIKSSLYVTALVCCLATSAGAQTRTQRASDIDGDHHSDMVLYRPSNGDWSVLKSSTSYTSSTVVNWGGSNYVPVPGDYDGDGRMDYGLYEPTTGTWLILKSTTNYSYSGGMSVSWGGEGYVAVPADYDGDGLTDPAVYVQSTGMWCALKSSTNFATSLTLSWGGLAYKPVPGGDYDGDTKADGALYYVPTGTWYVLLSGAGYSTSLSKTLGNADSVLVPGDYDGDGKTDVAVYDQTPGTWRILKSGSNFAQQTISWGGTGYAPVPSDFDGDNRIDVGVYRSANATWSILKSSSNYGATLAAVFGTASDSPVTPFPLPIGADHATGIDSPAPNSNTNQPFTITGWALDYPAASGTGVDAIQVLAYPNPGSGQSPITITNVNYGLQRSDVGAAYGTNYQNSGFIVGVDRLQARTYRFVVSAHASATNTWYTGRSVTINVGSEPYLGLYGPLPQHATQPFTISGWALDAAAAPPGTGVGTVEIWAYPTSGQPGVLLGNAAYGSADSTVTSLFGSQFTNSGFTYSVHTLMPGQYMMLVSAHSTVGNSNLGDSFIVDVDTSVAPLTVSHSSDEYNAPITVSLSTATLDAAISYSLNGGASSSYTGPFSVSQPSTLFASASLAGYVTATASRQYSFKVAAPTLSVPPGTYPGIIHLTMSDATPEATIYWTDDGSDPDPLTAHQYIGEIPIQPGTSKTIKARAIRTGWTPSAIVGGVYTADYSGPIRITAQVFPPRNQDGWNNSDVTVSFTCVNATVCPPPIVVSQETAGQAVSGTATNADTSATSSPVTVKLDKTPPTITLVSPPDTVPAGSLLVSGSIGDALSGIAAATCNGQLTTVSGGALACNVGVVYGLNAYVVQATDAAGNTNSVPGYISGTGTPSSLIVSPSKRTLVVGETVRLKALDDGGFRPASLSWTVADPSVASITDSTLTAIAVGTTSVTATAGTLSGQLDVTVLSDAVLPIGTIKWSVQPAAGFVDTGSVTVNANDEATSFVKMEAKWDPSIGEWGAYSPIRIRGLSAAGDTTFFTSTGLAANERPGLGSVMGDVTGGILMLVVKEPTTQAEWDYDQLHGGSPVSLVKVGTQRDSPGWRYPVGRGNDVPSALAQGKDGTVWGLRQFSSEIYAVDTSTGREKFRVTAPLSSAHYRSATCPQLNYDTSFHSPFLAPFSGVRIDRDGFVDVMVLQTDSTVGVIVSGDGNCTIVEYTVMSKVSTVSLYRISPTGSSQVIELGHYTTQGRSVTSGTGSSPLPDDTGGVLASWVVCEGQDVCDLRARHIGATGLGTEFSLSGGSHPIGEILAGPSVSGTGRVAYDSGGAIDMVSGARLWSKSPPSFPLPAATLESGRTLYTEIGALGPQGTIFDASGAVIATNQPVLVEWDGSVVPPLIDGDTQFGWLPDRTAFAAMVTTENYIEPDGGFPTLQGGPTRTNSPHTCDPTIDWFSKPLSAPRDYVFAFDDEVVPAFPSAGLQGVFTPAQKDLFWPGFVLWKFGGDKGFPNLIAPWVIGGPAPNLIVRKADLLFSALFSASLGLTEFPESVYSADNSNWGPSWAVRNRRDEGFPDFPVGLFGILVDRGLSDSNEVTLLKQTAVHEFGHVIGLGDAPKGCRLPTSVMTPLGSGHPSEPTARDKRALRNLLGIK